ncbi:MAG: hypothetical protein A2033_11060 [Bacteroidetes bacterium GWA2_31_9]|nr:MAG: hypothetical protein A2033_11060 [Bacteroidetes bacterium GWA2_31_9]
MKWFRKNKSNKNNEAASKKASLKDIIDGTVLTREIVVNQIPFFVFLALMAIVYIANRYQSEKIARETIKVQTDIKELRSESIATASELMYISKQSEVEKLTNINQLGLIVSIEPPKKILVND